MEILSCTAVELGRKIKEKELTAVQATQAVLDQIDRVENTVHAYVTVDKEGALKKAAEIQKKIDNGELTGPLAGVPVAIKDNMCTEGMLTTCSSKILYNFVPTFTAEAVKRLEDAGAVIIGKTNMDEFAMGSTTETSAYGVTRNPWNPRHVPGGSSGGSCAAVAAGETFYALGQRYRRIDPPAKLLLWRDRYQTDLRYGIPLGSDRLRFFPGSDRAGGEGCDRLCHDPRSDFRPRSEGFYFGGAWRQILPPPWWTTLRACVSVSRETIWERDLTRRSEKQF